MKTLLLFLFLLLPRIALGAISFGTASTAICMSCSSINVAAHVISGGCTNSLMIVGVTWDNGGPVTLSGISATGGALTSQATTEDGDSNHTTALYSRVGLSGSQSVTATFSGATFVAGMTVTTYCGVNQASPHGSNATATGNDTPVTVDLDANSGEWVVDTAFSHAALTVGAGQTQRAKVTDGSGFDHATSDEPGPGTITMSWTQASGHYWGTIALIIKPFVAPPGASTRRKAIVIQ
jgi:hypothetical protein